MADTAMPAGSGILRRLDRVALAIVALLAAVAVLDSARLPETVAFALGALGHTAPIIAVATIALAVVKAAGAETLVGRAFRGPALAMIVVAALVGGVSPFCSCQVIPFIAALLAVGAPLAAVMAFWLSSPLMDPAMFVVTSAVLGLDFALAKTAAAVLIGIGGGLVVHAFARGPVFADPLRPESKPGGCCGRGRGPFEGAPRWEFWREAPRRAVFVRTARDNVLFLGKWLALAYVIEALMIAYVPAGLIAGVLGGEGMQPILLGALVGAPAYLNGYAAVPLMDALLAQGMAPGAAMAFVVAGGMSSIPAAIAVWALVRARVFAAYLGFALVGALLAGLSWQFIA